MATEVKVTINMRHGPAWRVHLARWLVARGWLRLGAFVLDGTYLETESGRSRAYLDCGLVLQEPARNSPLDDL